MESPKVIKVKCGETLRRFSTVVNEYGELDLDMRRLREKVLVLFGLSLDANITFTYVDEDGDVIAVVDDVDLVDATKQSLNPLRITAILNPQSQKVQLFPVIKRIILLIVYHFPQIYQSLFLNLILELSSKATSTPSELAELKDFFSKFVDLVSKNISASSTRNGPSYEAKEVRKLNKSDFMEKAANSRLYSDMANFGGWGSRKLPPFLNKVRKNKINQKPVSSNLNVPSMRYSSHEAPIKPTGCFGESKEIPRKLDILSNSSPNQKTVSSVLNRPSNYSSPGTDYLKGLTGKIVHLGISCDGCGAYPIQGPRFNSKVRKDYDLCSICFSKMGDKADYVKMTQSVPQWCPLQSKWLFNYPSLTGSPTTLQHRFEGCKTLTKKEILDSRFVGSVAVPLGSVLAPSMPFTRIWRMRNTGGMIWQRGTKIVLLGGKKLSATTSVELQIPSAGLSVNDEINVAVDCASPQLPGQYYSSWRLASPSGKMFGETVYIYIQVNAPRGRHLNSPPETTKWKFSPPTASGKGNQIASAQESKDQDLDFPVNNTFLVGSGVSTSPESMSLTPTSVVDFSKVVSIVPSIEPSPQVDVPKPVQRAEKDDDNLIDDSEWDLILEELQEMGFCDTEMNKRLLENSGSIKSVAMDHVSAEN